MKVLISVAVWGRAYRATLADFSLATQLASENIPKLSQHHSVTYHIVTTHRDATWLKRHANFRELAKYVRVEWDYIENYGYNPAFIPIGTGGEKYPFLSRLQNIAIARSLGHDVIVFNYADFIWANGSLSNVIELMTTGTGAVLSFALPVDRNRGMRAVKRHRQRRFVTSAIELSPRVTAGIAMDHLHREAQLRYWDGERFTLSPTYLLWRVGNEGIVIRAYHQTVLALRVQPSDPRYAEGIRHGSLDGYFSAYLAESAQVEHATDSDTVSVFSLFDTNSDSTAGPDMDRAACLRKCLQHSISRSQRQFATMPILVKRRYDNTVLWDRVVQDSASLVAHYDETTDFDQRAYDAENIQPDIIAMHEARWRASKHVTPLRWVYQNIVLSILPGNIAAALKHKLGAERSRAIRLAVERWLFRSR